jgi:hypothetical protein
VDEVLELLLVLVGVVVRRIAMNAALLDEVLKGGLGVSRGAKTKLPRRFGG